MAVAITEDCIFIFAHFKSCSLRVWLPIRMKLKLTEISPFRILIGLGTPSTNGTYQE